VVSRGSHCSHEVKLPTLIFKDQTATLLHIITHYVTYMYLYLMPFSTIAPLQRVQKAAARLLLGLPRCDHVRPALKELHWLPVLFRIKFKVALMMFTVHTRCCPDYLTDSVQACNSDPGRTRLRSASSTNYSVPRTRTKFGDKAFSVAGPVVWNSLPAEVREADRLYSFKCKLKTHLFTMCFTD